VAEKRHVILFAKYPTPGRVKTRMIGPLTPEQAAEVHRLCLRIAMDTLMEAAMANAGSPVLCFTPDRARNRFREFLLRDARVTFWPQGDGDLGARMHRAVTRAFKHTDRVLLYGCDSPTVRATDIADALNALDDHDMVLGPALDGGYYLLALRRERLAGGALDFAPLFDDIEWGSGRVAEATRQRARSAGLTWLELPVHRDLDRRDDLAAVRPELRGGGPISALAGYIDQLSGKKAP